MRAMYAAVEWGLIGEVIWVSLVAGIGVTAMFSLVVYGSGRASEARREGGNPTLFAFLAGVMLLAFLGAVAFGIITILNK